MKEEKWDGLDLTEELEARAKEDHAPSLAEMRTPSGIQELAAIGDRCQSDWEARLVQSTLADLARYN